MSLLRPAIFDTLDRAQNVLLAGAGGGFDIFSGLPLYFALRNAGKNVYLANLSFSQLHGLVGSALAPALIEVNAEKVSEGDSYFYFPELYLSRWLHQELGEYIPIYCFDRVGAKPIAQAYKRLIAHLNSQGSKIDTVILVDGGTDSLMRGDEAGLGTPEEDIASINAVDLLEGVAQKLLIGVGFGVDTYHGVCHAQFLEAVAELIGEGGYMGAWSLTKEMPEVAAYQRAVEWVHERMEDYPSIVCSSISSAIDGRFGNYHATFRTQGSDNELFINPLMNLYWAFDASKIAQRILYRDLIQDTNYWEELHLAIAKFRALYRAKVKPWKSLPM